MSIIMISKFGFQLFPAFKETSFLLTTLISQNRKCNVLQILRSTDNYHELHLLSKSHTSVSTVPRKSLKRVPSNYNSISRTSSNPHQFWHSDTEQLTFSKRHSVEKNF